MLNEWADSYKNLVEVIKSFPEERQQEAIQEAIRILEELKGAK